MSDPFRNYGNMPPSAPYDPATGTYPHSNVQQRPTQSLAHDGYLGQSNPYESHPAPRQWPSAHGQFGNIPSRPESWYSGDLPQSTQPVFPPNVQMHPTEWDGVYVRTRPQDSQHFPHQAEQGLRMLASQPTGHALLQSIGDAPMPPGHNFGYKVAIQPAPSTKHEGRFRQSRHYDGTNVTKALNGPATSNGIGSASAISWNPQATQTPNGPRPPFIGLGHELIHAHHNLQGTSNIDDVADDEDQATGLGEHSSDPITENRLRAEHNIKLRRNY
jgi:hypothetical protein